MNGTVEPTSPTDQQCDHCRLFFGKRGHPPHEANCPLKGTNLVVAPAEQVERPDALDAEPEPVEIGPDPDGSAPTATGETGELAVSDGGETTEVLDPPEPEETDEGDEGDEEACPNCGSEEWFDPDDLPDEVLARDPELATFDRACHPCCTDENGHLSYPLEVFNVAS